MLKILNCILWTVASLTIFISTLVNAEGRNEAFSKWSHNAYSTRDHYLMERETIPQGFPKLPETDPKEMALLDDKFDTSEDKYTAEVMVNWFEDILKVRLSGPHLPQLKNGTKIPSAALDEIIEVMRCILYSEGMSLGTLIDKRPELAGKIRKIIEASNIVRTMGGESESPFMDIRIPLSKIRAAIFSLGDFPATDKTFDEAPAKKPVLAETAKLRSLSSDQQKLVEAFDWPDTFILYFDSDPDNPQRTLIYESWNYYAYLTQFEFIEGDLVQSKATEIFGDLAIRPKSYRPTQFFKNMDTQTVKALFPGLTFADAHIPSIYGQQLTMMTGDQIIFGFEKGRLQYVETSLLVPQGGLQ